MEKINIAELIKDCPAGTKFYSPIFGDVYLNKIRPHLAIVVTTDKEQGDFKEEFLYDGRYGMNGECMLFPSKNKTTWEGFEPPFKFKDGDILVHTQNQRFIMSICHKIIHESLLKTHCILLDKGEGLRVNQEICWYKDSIRLATEEEKQKLFDAIEDNGYRWNSETKTLEKLIVPKFKVGDKIQSLKFPGVCNTVTKVCEGFYLVNSDENEKRTIQFDAQHDWELVPVEIKPKFKVGDKVVRKNGIGVPVLITKVGKEFYYSNNGYSVDCFVITDQDDYEIVSDKFDISTLVPFESKVLVRDFEDQIWRPAIFGGYIDNREQYKFTVVGGLSYECLIPYEGNEHLRCKDGDCKEFYKTWKL